MFIFENQPSRADARVSISAGDSNFQRKLADFRNEPLFKIDFRNKPEDRALLAKISGSVPALSSLVTVKAGVKMYERGKGQPPQTAQVMKDRPFSTVGPCPPGWLPLYRGGDVSRYALQPAREFVNYGPWLAAARSPSLFSEPKILMRRTDDRLLATLEEDRAISVNSCHVIKWHSGTESQLDYRYLLAACRG